MFKIRHFVGVSFLFVYFIRSISTKSLLPAAEILGKCSQVDTNINISNYPAACDSDIFCRGKLLHTIQMAHLFSDSKTFVDMKLKQLPEEVFASFDKLMEETSNKPSKDQLKQFVDTNFSPPGSEFENWDPVDWKSEPRFLDQVRDSYLRSWGSDLNGLWKQLGRKMTDDVKENPILYSIIPVDNPVIVPGGRFREFYYWDSYWVIKGLLHSEMLDTAKGMLENFMSIIERFGFIPNGGRIYYTHRSQPPLFPLMVKAYVEATSDDKFAIETIKTLEHEFQFWMNNHTRIVNGHCLAYYGDKSSGPRPESYREDVETASAIPLKMDRENVYSELKAAAESGMDFSSRWFINSNGTNEGTLKDLKTRSIIPVELNAILYNNAKIIAEFYSKAGNVEKSTEYELKAQELFKAIEAVLWHEDIGTWLDYDIINNKRRNYFTPTNLAPLWVKCYNIAESDKISKLVLHYIKTTSLDKYPGGVPNTFQTTGEQWDFPNVWPPMQHMLIIGLDNLGTIESKKLALKWTKRWVQSNYDAYKDSTHMFEKYNAEKFGGYGSGGEYEIQLGFGWSNGVIIDLLAKYGDILKPDSQTICNCTDKIEKSKTNSGSSVFKSSTVYGSVLVAAIALLVTTVARSLWWEKIRQNAVGTFRDFAHLITTNIYD